MEQLQTGEIKMPCLWILNSLWARTTNMGWAEFWKRVTHLTDDCFNHLDIKSDSMWVSLIILYEEGFAWLKQLNQGKGLWLRQPLPLEKQDSLSLGQCLLRHLGFVVPILWTLAFFIHFIRSLTASCRERIALGTLGSNSLKFMCYNLHLCCNFFSFFFFPFSFFPFTCMPQSRNLEWFQQTK